MTSHKNDTAVEMQATLEPEPKLCMPENQGSKIHIGLVGNYSDTDETRLLLTPEACGMLTSYGIRISMEAGAGVDISFPDEVFAEYGVEIVTREEALKCNTVLSFQSLRAKDIKKMTKGASLLCTMGHTLFEESTIKALISQHISCGCLDNMVSRHDVTIFADILDEIDGRAAIMYAQESLSYLGGGKGVLLAGLAGLNPCEVLVIGNGLKAISAANAAASAGARVVLLDNDASSLQQAGPSCNSRVDRILIHPRVLTNLVKSADVIIMANTTREFTFPKSLSSSLKDSIYVLDLNETHPSISVPRTVAMAISNPLFNFIEEMSINNGLKGMLVTSPGVRAGMVTYEGKLVDKLIGSCIGMPSIDIRVMISSTN